MNAIVIRNDGTTERLQIDEFDELQRQCGGDVYRLGPNGATFTERLEGRTVESPSILAEQIEHLTMWCNEEGRMLEMAANVVATLVVGWPVSRDTVIVGDVVITGPTDREGKRTAVSDSDLELVEYRAKWAREYVLLMQG